MTNPITGDGNPITGDGNPITGDGNPITGDGQNPETRSGGGLRDFFISGKYYKYYKFIKGRRQPAPLMGQNVPATKVKVKRKTQTLWIREKTRRWRWVFLIQQGLVLPGGL